MPPAVAYPPVIAHRCGGIHAPENTLAGLRAAAGLGLRAVEFDVMLCGDGTPILMHDETLLRTTGDLRSVAEVDWADVSRLDTGPVFRPGFSREPVPDFGSAARLCIQLGLWAHVEIKPYPGQEAETGRIVAREAHRYWPDGQGVVLSSFSELALRSARSAAPALPRALLVESIEDDWAARLQALEARALHADWQGLESARVAEIRERGIPLAVYTVNDQDLARRLLAWGVTSLFSDHPELVPNLVGRHG